MGTFRRFEDIEAWQKARILAKEIYAVSRQGPFAQDFGLRDQIRRASVSILSNITEGYERDGTKEFLHFLSIAKGSAGEVRAQLYVALDQDYITQDQFDHLSIQAAEISRMINGLMKYLRQSQFKGLKYKT